MSEDIENLIATLKTGIGGKTNYAYNLAGLAEVVAQRKHRLRALELAREAMAAAGDDPRAAKRARGVMASLIPAYHISMMNDVPRNAAWDKALRRAIRPGMRVFEIGTGAGMLALMAARAGALVTTCEMQPVSAQLARELAERNGLADRITVVGKSSREVQLGTDLPERADLLFCDIFADNLFDFEPFPLIADARKRLLKPEAPALPSAVSVHVALAWSSELNAGIGDTCGFDLVPMRDFVAGASATRLGAEIHLLSSPGEAFYFDMTHAPATGGAEMRLQAGTDCLVNGVARWIRLELGDETALESRPGTRSFSRPMFVPFASTLVLKAGDALRIGLAHHGKVLETWLAGRG